MPDSKVARAPDDAFELDKGIAGESNAKKSNNNIHPYPTGIKLAIIIASLAASVFLVALVSCVCTLRPEGIPGLAEPT